MILLLVQQGLRNEHGKVYILYSYCFESCIQLLLDQLPDRIARGLDHHTSFYASVITQLCFLHYIGIPLGEIFFHGSDRFYHFLVCHFLSPFLFLKINCSYDLRKRKTPGHRSRKRDRSLGGTTLIDTNMYPALSPLTPVLRCASPLPGTLRLAQDSKGGFRSSVIRGSQPHVTVSFPSLWDAFRSY